jgi:hypothetical protein
MAFKLMYPDKFAKSNDRWPEFVCPHWTLLGKDIDDDIYAQLITYFCHDTVAPVWSCIQSLRYEHYLFKNYTDLCEKMYFSFRRYTKVNLWT